MATMKVEKILKTNELLESIADGKIADNLYEKPFYVADLDDVRRKHVIWQQLMPRIKPFYAVKCNDLPELISFLASLGTNFDCASRGEIQQVLSLGVTPDRIIFANPCKTSSSISYARDVKVNLMTFDNEAELDKVAKLHPEAKLILRIKGVESSSQCKFNMKFGADFENCHHLLRTAMDLKLAVVGVSFHNGSGCLDAESYAKSIASCRNIFDFGNKMGHAMTILDIGGGFPGDLKAKISFSAISQSVGKALDEFFSSDSSQRVEIIAEPGRYFVSSAFTLFCMVIAKRSELDERSGKMGFMYYLNDGVYSAFNNIIYENAQPEPQLIPGHKYEDSGLLPTIMWGPTCDSVDCVKRDFQFPKLEVGQWIMFKDMGAYTCCAASAFNGFEVASVIIRDKIDAKPTSSTKQIEAHWRTN